MLFVIMVESSVLMLVRKVMVKVEGRVVLIFVKVILGSEGIGKLVGILGNCELMVFIGNLSRVIMIEFIIMVIRKFGSLGVNLCSVMMMVSVFMLIVIVVVLVVEIVLR